MIDSLRWKIESVLHVRRIPVDEEFKGEVSYGLRPLQQPKQKQSEHQDLDSTGTLEVAQPATTGLVYGGGNVGQAPPPGVGLSPSVEFHLDDDNSLPSDHGIANADEEEKNSLKFCGPLHLTGLSSANCRGRSNAFALAERTPLHTRRIAAPKTANTSDNHQGSPPMAIGPVAPIPFEGIPPALSHQGPLRRPALPPEGGARQELALAAEVPPSRAMRSSSLQRSKMTNNNEEKKERENLDLMGNRRSPRTNKHFQHSHSLPETEILERESAYRYADPSCLSRSAGKPIKRVPLRPPPETFRDAGPLGISSLTSSISSLAAARYGGRAEYAGNSGSPHHAQQDQQRSIPHRFSSELHVVDSDGSTATAAGAAGGGGGSRNPLEMESYVQWREQHPKLVRPLPTTAARHPLANWFDSGKRTPDS